MYRWSIDYVQLNLIPYWKNVIIFGLQTETDPFECVDAPMLGIR